MTIGIRARLILKSAAKVMEAIRERLTRLETLIGSDEEDEGHSIRIDQKEL